MNSHSRRSMFFALVMFSLALGATDAEATDLRITVGPTSVENDRIELGVAWRNAWRNERNFDAVWITLRGARDGGASDPLDVALDGHAVASRGNDDDGDLPSPSLTVIAADDRSGVFVFLADEYRGDVDAVVDLQLDEALDSEGVGASVLATGVEMVYIPCAPFTLGEPMAKDGDPRDQQGVLYRSDDDGERAGLYRVESEGAIDVAPREGALFYLSNDVTSGSRYRGDQLGPIPETFPKGYDAFFIMKYEMSQGEYATFLNQIPRRAVVHRAITRFPGDRARRHTIEWTGEGYVSTEPERPMNFLSWDDAMAWTDHSRLRPMTELEFVKAARGDRAPIAEGRAWGTTDDDQVMRIFDERGRWQGADAYQEARLTDRSRPVLGASYFWVMDLSSGLWERCVSIGSPEGSRFVGSHGDGALGGPTATATNPDWPRGDEPFDRLGSGGYGYRGGGHYDHTNWERERFLIDRGIAKRRFGAWGEGPRHIAYGYRAARSAPDTLSGSE